VLRAQQTGDVLQAIVTDKRFSITALFSVHLTAPLAEELLDIYRGVLPNYTLTVDHLCSAPLLAVLVTGRNDTDVVSDFRDLTGPINPQLAKVVRPQSLRAVFGNDAIKNAVHCTDLSCDGAMECKYIFETVASL
jgi:nucleoside-diphosphate kinase